MSGCRRLGGVVEAGEASGGLVACWLIFLVARFLVAGALVAGIRGGVGWQREPTRGFVLVSGVIDSVVGVGRPPGEAAGGLVVTAWQGEPARRLVVGIGKREASGRLVGVLSVVFIEPGEAARWLIRGGEAATTRRGTGLLVVGAVVLAVGEAAGGSGKATGGGGSGFVLVVGEAFRASRRRCVGLVVGLVAAAGGATPTGEGRHSIERVAVSGGCASAPDVVGHGPTSCVFGDRAKLATRCWALKFVTAVWMRPDPNKIRCVS